MCRYYKVLWSATVCYLKLSFRASPNTYEYIFDGDDITESLDSFFGEDFEEDLEIIDNEENVEYDEERLGVVLDKAYLKPKNDLYQWQHDIIGTPEAYAAGFKGDGVRVAVIDSGLNNSLLSLWVCWPVRIFEVRRFSLSNLTNCG